MTIKIIAATLTTKELELITEEGVPITLPQGHPKIPMLIEKVLPITSRGEVVVISQDDLKTESIFNSFEEKTGGLVKFFQVAKYKISELFSYKKGVSLNSTKQEEPIEEVLSQVAPNNTEYTTVAKVGDSYIPGMEKLSSHFHHSLSQMGNTKGIIRFLERIGSVIQDRQHSIEDLLTFMEKADLPIADDGSIIIYKGLDNSKTPNIYVDKHTKNVTQKVGTLVYMDVAAVDDNRRIDCAQGLHVARKGYLTTFRTDVITLAKVNPEDVITVPTYDPEKMRVSAYHILFVLPDADAERVRNSQEMEQGSIGSKMLAACISGNHIDVTSKVYIGGPKGSRLVLEGFDEAKQEEPESYEDVKPVAQVKEFSEHTLKVAPVDVLETVTKMKKIKKMTRSEEIRMLIEQHRSETDPHIRRDILVNLLDIKRTAKKTWDYHGVSKADAKRIKELSKGL